MSGCSHDGFILFPRPVFHPRSGVVGCYMYLLVNRGCRVSYRTSTPCLQRQETYPAKSYCGENDKMTKEEMPMSIVSFSFKRYLLDTAEMSRWRMWYIGWHLVIRSEPAPRRGISLISDSQPQYNSSSPSKIPAFSLTLLTQAEL